jgi:hypothetical protein
VQSRADGNEAHLLGFNEAALNGIAAKAGLK